MWLPSAWFDLILKSSEIELQFKVHMLCVNSMFTLRFEFELNILKFSCTHTIQCLSRSWFKIIIFHITLIKNETNGMVLPNNIWSLIDVCKLFNCFIIFYRKSFTISPPIAANWLEQIDWRLSLIATVVSCAIFGSKIRPINTLLFVIVFPILIDLGKYRW